MVRLPTFVNKCSFFFTRFKYSHISICLDSEFKKFYAFQIKNIKTPLVGGFMEENESYFFQAKNITSLNEIVFELPVTDEEYTKISNYITTVKEDKEYIFNYVSALFMFLIGGIRVYKSFHCCEFACEVLNNIDSIKLPKKTYKMHPKDLYKLLIKFEHYEKTINIKDFEFDNDNIFFKKIKLKSVIKKSYYTVTENVIRSILKRPIKNIFKRIVFSKSFLNHPMRSLFNLGVNFFYRYHIKHNIAPIII